MKYRIQCANCDWTLTDPNSVRVYARSQIIGNQDAEEEELFSRLVTGENDKQTACLSENFNLESDGSFPASILHAYRLSGELVVSDSGWGFVCAECGHDLQEAGQMKWYVRALESGEVWGPMSQAEAEKMRDQLDDAIMFNERIFEPQFVVSEEVEDLIGEMKGLRTSLEIIRNGEDDAVGLVCQRVIDALVLLSKKEEPESLAVSDGVEDLIRHLRGMQKGACIIDRGNLQSAIDALTFFSKSSLADHKRTAHKLATLEARAKAIEACVEILVSHEKSQNPMILYTGETGQLVADLRSFTDNITTHFDHGEFDALRELLKRAIEGLVSLSREK